MLLISDGLRATNPLFGKGRVARRRLIDFDLRHRERESNSSAGFSELAFGYSPDNRLSLDRDRHRLSISGLPIRSKSVYYPREDASLTAIRANLRSDRRPKPSTLGLAAIVCLILLVLLAVAQVTHVHAVGSDADHCPLCVVIHSVVPFVVMAVGIVMIRLGTATQPPLEVRTICRYWHPTLFNRPPPAGC